MTNSPRARPLATAQDHAPDPNAKPGGDIVITYKDDVATLDPAIGYDWQNWSMIKSIFDGLMDYVPGTTELAPISPRATRSPTTDRPSLSVSGPASCSIMAAR